MKHFIRNNLKKILVISFCFCVCLSKIAQNVPVTMNDPLCNSMQASGAEINRSYITGKANITIEKNQKDAIQKIFGDICDNFKINLSEAVVEEQTSNYQKCLKLSYYDNNKQLIISAKNINCEENNKKNIELIIHIIQEKPLHTDIIKTREKISEILKKFSETPLITTCLEGYLDGKLRKDEWEFCIKDSFAAINAKMITGMCNEYYASYTGYSDLLAQKIIVDKQYVNFNIAMRYHEFDNRTYVIIGSPLITIEY